ncbi:MAG: glycosyltransferase [Eubacterium sp.]|nr:glycosyltransferase [Eubacterium sp.]
MHILYFAPIAFGYLKQRPQYLAEQLARVHTVYYIEPTVSFAASVHKNELHYRKKIQKRSKTLYVIRLDGKFSLPYRWKYADKYALTALYEYLQAIRIIKKIDLIWIGYPGWYGVAHYFRGVRVVYDVMDDYVRLTRDKKTRAYIQRSCRKLETTADIILTSSAAFYERLQREHKHVFLVPNAMPDSYRKAGWQEALKKKADSGLCKNNTAHAVYGYIGVIAEWFDNTVIEYLAGCKGSRVVLAGPVLVPRVQKENVEYIGEIPKADVPQFIQNCDVCLYPFLPGPLLETINPVKIYEYLAFQKPVIARRSRETEQFAGMVSLYSDKKELCQILEAGIRQPFPDAQAYHRFAAKNCWSYRGRQILEILETGTKQAGKENIWRQQMKNRTVWEESR